MPTHRKDYRPLTTLASEDSVELATARRWTDRGLPSIPGSHSAAPTGSAPHSSERYVSQAAWDAWLVARGLK